MIDEFSYELGKRAASGGGGEAVLIDKTISANGTYNASSDNADGFKKAVVNVPNSYSAGDEGKVVSNGALVAQSSDSVTQNGTVDTTLISSLEVNVSGGGGYGYTKLAEQDFTVNTSSTSETSVGTINAGASAWTSDKIIYVRVRDKAGKRTGYWLGIDQFVVNINPANHSTVTVTPSSWSFGYASDGTFKSINSRIGVYAATLNSAGDFSISAKYSGTYGFINGEYHVEVYALDWPDGVSPFNQGGGI